MKKILFIIVFLAFASINAKCVMAVYYDDYGTGGTAYYYSTLVVVSAPTSISFSAAWQTFISGQTTTVVVPNNVSGLQQSISSAEQQLLQTQMNQTDQQQQTLFNILSNVLKTMNDMLRSIVRNLL